MVRGWRHQVELPFLVVLLQLLLVKLQGPLLELSLLLSQLNHLDLQSLVLLLDCLQLLVQFGLLPLVSDVLVDLLPLLDPDAHVLVGEQRLCRRPLVRVLQEHGRDEVHQLVRVVRRDAVQLACPDFYCELVVGCRLEWSSQCCDLVDDAAQRPDIALLVILLVIDLFWAHVVGRADVRVGEDRLVPHDARKAKVSQLHVVVCVEEYIAGLQITMEDFAFLPSVARMQSLQDLAENGPDHVLGQVRLLLATRPDHRRNVTALAVLHHDEYLGVVSVYDSVVVPHDVGMAELAQNVDL